MTAWPAKEEFEARAKDARERASKLRQEADALEAKARMFDQHSMHEDVGGLYFVDIPAVELEVAKATGTKSASRVISFGVSRGINLYPNGLELWRAE